VSQTEKAALFKELQEAGTTFERHYREYTTAELQQAVDILRQRQGAQPVSQHVEPPEQPGLDERVQEEARPSFDQVMDEADQTDEPLPVAPVAHRHEAELPGQRLNELAEDEPLRVDPETGFIWYQEEVAKPAFPKPRGRRILRYVDTGVKRVSAQNGDYTEEFEVAGDEVRREAEDYFGGYDMVPEGVKRIYVENVLCYDIRTVVRAIQFEYRQLQLAGKVE
jgi:hypothetical protein